MFACYLAKLATLSLPAAAAAAVVNMHSHSQLRDHPTYDCLYAFTWRLLLLCAVVVVAQEQGHISNCFALHYFIFIVLFVKTCSWSWVSLDYLI